MNKQAAIITSLIDTDLYKLTMMQCVLHQCPSAMVEYKFKCRTPNINLLPFIDEINHEIDNLCQLRFKASELKFIASLDYIKTDFVDFLRLFQLNRTCINVKNENNELDITIKGPWLHTILFEVPVLAIINEIYFKNLAPDYDFTEGKKRLDDKIELVKNHPKNENFQFSDFGTRRRFNKKWHEYVVKTLKDSLPHNFIGTSNLYLAHKYNLLPIGTMAHEFLQAFQALGPRLADSQKFALESWVKEYRGRLGIALTDVINIDAFLNDFDLYFTKLFDGLRQDSGNPIEWGNKVIKHYNKMKVDISTKTMVFSDGLTFNKALNIYDTFKKYFKIAFGIGTNLTNDVGFPAISIVIKMVQANNQSVAKLSDSPDKSMCKDQDYIEYLKKVFKVEEIN